MEYRLKLAISGESRKKGAARNMLENRIRIQSGFDKMENFLKKF